MSAASKQPLDPTNLESLPAVNGAMFRLLKATLRHERLITARDEEIAGIYKQHTPAIDKTAAEISTTKAQIERYYRANRELLELNGKKSVQVSGGTIGMRACGNPALVPLNDEWTWDAIAAKVRRIWKSKYFHKPKPPGLDKVKLKADLGAAQLKRCGLALEESESFYCDLNRAAAPDEPMVEAA